MTSQRSDGNYQIYRYFREIERELKETNQTHGKSDKLLVFLGFVTGCTIYQGNQIFDGLKWQKSQPSCTENPL